MKRYLGSYSVALALGITGLLAFSSCKSVNAYFGRSSMGANYFASDFECKTQLEAESDERIRGLRIANFQLPFARDTQQRGVGGARVVIAGDSIAALFTPTLSAAYLPGIDVANRGIPGDTTAMLLQRLDTDIVPLRPKLVVISIGGNDLIMGRCLELTMQNTLAIVQHLRQQSPGVRIALLSIPPTVAERPNTITPFYNQRLRSALGQETDLSFVDLWPELSRSDRPGLRDEFRIPLGPAFDLVHFNAEGYRVVARRIAPLIEAQRP
ncbi:MAG: hypothetical protein K1X75_01995 [Leptospirales bacterium]|nr:hypothetical protein [Leptospirales bacterium]